MRQCYSEILFRDVGSRPDPLSPGGDGRCRRGRVEFAGHGRSGVRTVSGPVRMRGDIFAAARRWRVRVLPTGNPASRAACRRGRGRERVRWDRLGLSGRHLGCTVTCRSLPRTRLCSTHSLLRMILTEREKLVFIGTCSVQHWTESATPTESLCVSFVYVISE